ncbi:MAG: L-seryl-tRNA(Sec) selenium transferase, partial [Candidatus Riflebacteria bacterium]|nr:L-seryl-tRNA(Sec) selenium transferase [Candidatus Riflebacteria bacterium]
PSGAEPWQSLPSVSDLLDEPRVQELTGRQSRAEVLEAIDLALAGFRCALRPGDSAPDTEQVLRGVTDALERRLLERLRPVINATGIILHTGLGRAVLPRRAAEGLALMDRPCNMQMDLETGLRGKRSHRTEALLTRLTGAEAALVVNNNAAATLLVLSALCRGKEVLVSRGQLIEIGGSFRLLNCVHQSGAILVEVGSTNKTHLADYESAFTENTGAILRVNPSNYKMIGFTKQVTTAELVRLKKKRDVLVIDDLGCGVLVDLEKVGLPHEPMVQESLAAGADVACFSGDKLIGGPQAGIIVGRAELIGRLKKHPLTRMLRIGKLTDMALERTLELFLRPETLLEDHPTLRMAATPARAVRQRASRLKRRLGAVGGPVEVRVVSTESAMGGGALPGVPIPSWALAVRSSSLSADRLAAQLRLNSPPIIGRIREDEVILDLRTVLPGEEMQVLEALRRIAGTPSGPTA